jgi:calcium-binding protein CML
MSIEEAEGVSIPHDGIDLDKFVELVLMCMKGSNWAKNEMAEAFRIFDKDDSGFIDPNELRRVFTRIGENLMETELEDQLREVDIDGDLRVS